MESEGGSGFSEIGAEEAEEDGVVEAAEVVPALAEVAFADEAQAFEETEGSVVVGIDIGFEAVEEEGIEGEGDEMMDGFGAEAVAPGVAAEGEADFSAAMGEVEVVQGTGAEEAGVGFGFDAPLEEGAGMEESLDFLDEAVSGGEVGEGRGAPVAHDFGITEDGEDGGGIGFDQPPEVQAGGGEGGEEVAPGLGRGRGKGGGWRVHWLHGAWGSEGR